MNKLILDDLSKNKVKDRSTSSMLPHQVATVDFLLNTCYINKKSVLLYHKMGSGKTLLALLFALIVSIDTRILIILPNISILTIWKDQLRAAMVRIPKIPVNLNNIDFKTKNSFKKDGMFADDIVKTELFNYNLVIVDEAHNFFQSRIGDILKELRRKLSITYLLVTGSPMTNTVHTICDIFELLTGIQFDSKLYLRSDGGKVYDWELTPDGVKYTLKHIQGTVSYYHKKIKDVPEAFYSGKRIFNYPVELCYMSKIQEDNYMEIAETTRNEMFVKMLMAVSLCALGPREVLVNDSLLTCERELLPGLYASKGMLYGEALIKLDISTKMKALLTSITTERGVGKRFTYFANSTIGSIVIRSILTANGISEYGKDIVSNPKCVVCINDKTCDVCIPMKFCIITSKECYSGNSNYINDLLDIYNSDYNEYGHDILLLFGSKIISEAYTIKDTWRVNFLTTPETKTELLQCIARVVRSFSHKDTTKQVIIVIYIATFKSSTGIKILKNTVKKLRETSSSRTNESFEVFEKRLADNPSALTYDVRKQLYLELKAIKTKVVESIFKDSSTVLNTIPNQKILPIYLLEKIKLYAYDHDTIIVEKVLADILNIFKSYGSDFKKIIEKEINNIIDTQYVVYNKYLHKCFLYRMHNIIYTIPIRISYNNYLMCAEI